jgi:Uma2 family endonuclease
MTTATLSDETLGDLLHSLGNISPDRILLRPPPGTATENDALSLLEGEFRRRVELIDGTLVEKPMGVQEAFLAGWLLTLLNQFIAPRRLGLVGGADMLVRLIGGQLRLPDVSYFPWTQIPPGFLAARVGTLSPALAVEVLSVSNTRAEMERKRREYFASGTQLVWLVDPRSETVAVYTDPTAHTTLTTADTLNGGAVLPGFSVPVTELFSYLDPPAAA